MAQTSQIKLTSTHNSILNSRLRRVGETQLQRLNLTYRVLRDKLQFRSKSVQVMTLTR